MNGDGTPAPCSRIQGFYRLPREERLRVLAAFADLSAADLAALDGDAPFHVLDAFVENAVGAFPLPLAIATNFRIDGVDRLVPMVVEESSVVAAASNMARLVREGGGFRTEVVSDLMIGQVQLTGVRDPEACRAAVLGAREELLALADACQARLVERGGGCRDVEVRLLDASDEDGFWMAVHLLVDVQDAMGANMVNTMCETLAPRIEALTGAKVGLRILSNLSDRRVVRATCRVPVSRLSREGMGGAEVRDRIVAAARFAEVDPYRAATHNKGIMNGIDPVAVATGNDWRAIEAGVHAWAARDGRYRSVSRWTVDPGDGALLGHLEVPLQVGTVGGVTRLHPVARLSIRILGVERASDLARIMASVGLSQNLGALRALATEGIQRGHMRMHAKNVALASGASLHEVEQVAVALVAGGEISAVRAESLLAELRRRPRAAAPEPPLPRARIA